MEGIHPATLIGRSLTDAATGYRRPEHMEMVYRQWHQMHLTKFATNIGTEHIQLAPHLMGH